ncbi:MAG: signal peptidase II [Victivallaceae bacterium]|nr:signal peptidase II [Victivallaceae bacterium]
MAFFDRLASGSRREKRTFALAIFVGGAALLLDGATKIFFERHLHLGERIPVLPGWFDLTLVRNTGAAWSLFAGHGSWLLIVALVMAAAIFRYFRALTENCPERYYAVWLILAGIAGNSIDRLWRGAVVDFLSFHYFDAYYYPVFNVADIAICVGTGIYLFSTFCRKSPPGEEK